MSYYATRFTGAITVTPPITHTLLAELDAFRPGTHVRDVQLVLAETADAIEPVRRRFAGYAMEQHLAELVDTLVRHGCELSGAIRADGEEPGDIWRLVVRDGEVHREEARVVWPDGTEASP